MKKLLCVLISVSLIITSCVFTYAKGGKHENEKKGHNTSQVSNYNTQIDNSYEKDLKDKIKKASKDLEEMKRLLRDLQKSRKKHNHYQTMVVIDGDELNTEVPPVIKYGRTLVPIRAIMDGLKADVKWDPATRTVTVTKAVYSDVYGLQNNVVEITLGSDIIKFNGVEMKNDAPAEIYSNRTMVPIRLISQLFKLKVSWDPESGAVIIQKTETYVFLPNTPTPVPTISPTPSATPTAPAATEHVTTAPPPTATSTPVAPSATPVPAT